jgi:hypothetical protein
MMEARPAAALIMPEADFLLEVVIIALDAPAQLGEVDEAAEQYVAVDGRESLTGSYAMETAEQREPYESRGHVRFWESPEVKVLRATRQNGFWWSFGLAWVTTLGPRAALFAAGPLAPLKSL